MVTAMVCGMAGITAVLGAPVPAPDAFARGLERYEVNDYEAAIEAFEEAVQQDPHSATYHRWLGKAYGRQAQRSNWLKAIDLARKTKAAFERAVELDPNDVAALSDLADYYEIAFNFLGGDREKARAIRRRKAALNRGIDNTNDVPAPWPACGRRTGSADK